MKIDQKARSFFIPPTFRWCHAITQDDSFSYNYKKIDNNVCSPLVLRKNKTMKKKNER